MKPFLAVVAGFVVGLGIFSGGIVFATAILTAEPERAPGPSMDVADLWTIEPRRVESDSQDFERVASARTVKGSQNEEGAVAEVDAKERNDELGLDTTNTASVKPETDEDSPEETAIDDQLAAELIAAHVGWCSQRYRSYRASDDTYRPYSGGRRACASPYSQDLDALAELMSTDGPDDGYLGAEDENGYLSAELNGTYFYAVDDSAGALNLDARHVQDCFSRYRSYRPEDNTYQPYGGGPRKQCR